MTESLLAAPAANTQTPDGQPATAAGGSEQPAGDEQTKDLYQTGETSDEATETPTGEEKPAEGEEAEEKPPEKPLRGAPESYELTTPEGAPDGHELDSEVVTAFEEVARNLDLTQEGAQQILDGVWPKLLERGQVLQQEAQERQSKQWLSETRKVSDLHDGDGFDANMKLANQTLHTYGDESLWNLLEGPQGLGNHPGFVSLLVRIGKAMQPDGFVGGKPQEREPAPSLNDNAAMGRKLFNKT